MGFAVMIGMGGTGVMSVGAQTELKVVVVNVLGCSSDELFMTFESTLWRRVAAGG
jgi:hypothetical protein